jgi:hypothetical protein
MAHMKQTEAGVWYLTDDWHIEDVQNVRPDLDDDQCIHVLEVIADSFDANNGINWDVIEYTANSLFPDLEGEDDNDI